MSFRLFLENKSKKVFLGGTVNSKWRDKLIPKLKIEYFNPVVKNWKEENYQEELKQRKICDYCLYFITPMMEGVYSIAEVVDDSHKQPKKTIFFVLKKEEQSEFSEKELKSLEKVGKLVENNGGKYFTKWDDLVNYLNAN